MNIPRYAQTKRWLIVSDVRFWHVADIGWCDAHVRFSRVKRICLFALHMSASWGKAEITLCRTKSFGRQYRKNRQGLGRQAASAADGRGPVKEPQPLLLASSSSTARRCARSPRGRLRWFQTSQARPSSQSRTRGCSTNSASRYSSRLLPPRCSKLSVVRPLTCRWCSARWLNRRAACVMRKRQAYGVPRVTRSNWLQILVIRLLT